MSFFHQENLIFGPGSRMENKTIKIFNVLHNAIVSERRTE